MFVVLSGEGIKRLLYLISLTLFYNGREHNSWSNNAAVVQANKAIYILRFIKFYVKISDSYISITEIKLFSTTQASLCVDAFNLRFFPLLFLSQIFHSSVAFCIFSFIIWFENLKIFPLDHSENKKWSGYNGQQNLLKSPCLL